MLSWFTYEKMFYKMHDGRQTWLKKLSFFTWHYMNSPWNTLALLHSKNLYLSGTQANGFSGSKAIRYEKKIIVGI